MEEEMATVTPMTNDDKHSRGNRIKIVAAIACVVAVCGIGFGVYGMMQSSEKDSQISDLRTKLGDGNQLIENIDNNETVEAMPDIITANSEVNPIYEGASSAKIYINTESGVGYGEMSVSALNGNPTCFISEREAEEGNIFGKVINTENCSILGIEGNISKVVSGNTGKNNIFQNMMVFLMADGNVYYIDNTEWNNEYEAKKMEMELGKKAIDIVPIDYEMLIRFNDNTVEPIKD